MMITGRCECGEVSYEVDAEITDFKHQRQDVL